MIGYRSYPKQIFKRPGCRRRAAAAQYAGDPPDVPVYAQRAGPERAGAALDPGPHVLTHHTLCVSPQVVLEGCTSCQAVGRHQYVFTSLLLVNA